MSKSTVLVRNISEETQQVRPFATSEKVTLKPGEAIECDRDYAESNYLAVYSRLFRAEGGAKPGLKEVLEFIASATDEEKTEIITALGISPADDDDPAPDASEQKTEEAETAGTDEQATEGDSASNDAGDKAPEQVEVQTTEGTSAPDAGKKTTVKQPAKKAEKKA